MTIAQIGIHNNVLTNDALFIKRNKNKQISNEDFFEINQQKTSTEASISLASKSKTFL